MPANQARTNLFNGRSGISPNPIRPPWAIPETNFDEVCTSCGDCISACPQQIISFGRGKLPVVSLANAECTFCEECVNHCKAGSLNKASRSEPWSHKAQISRSCISFQGVTCRICGDACEQGAIRFTWQTGGLSFPELKSASCNGCGACIAPCPSRAIQLYQPQINAIPQEKIA